MFERRPSARQESGCPGTGHSGADWEQALQSDVLKPMAAYRHPALRLQWPGPNPHPVIEKPLVPAGGFTRAMAAHQASLWFLGRLEGAFAGRRPALPFARRQTRGWRSLGERYPDLEDGARWSLLCKLAVHLGDERFDQLQAETAARPVLGPGRQTTA
jgi:hypothetical protein